MQIAKKGYSLSFVKGDPMFLQLLPSLFSFLLAILVLFANQIQAQKIHLLVASDQSEWAGWGEYLPNIELDTTFLALAFENNVPENQLQLEHFHVELEPGEPKQILEELDRFQVNEQDAFVFYFSGHGESDDRGHYLNFEKGKLYRSQIIETMKAKNPRLVVVLTDCCNVRGDKFGHFAPNVEAIRPSQISPLFESLFLRPQGLVNVNSCSPGESAYFFKQNEWGEPQGSLFSATLIDVLESNGNRRLTWGQVIDHVSLMVFDAFQRDYPNGITTTIKGYRGDTRQREQNVHAIEYPGMPEKAGPRTGIIVRDHFGQGAVIVSVDPQGPGGRVYDIASRKYVSLRPDQVVIQANGKSVTNAQDLFNIARASPQVMRLTTRDPTESNRNFLMRLKY